MVDVGVWLGLGTLICGFVVIWRVFVIEEALHQRVDDIDSSLGAVVGAIIEKIEAYFKPSARYQPHKYKTQSARSLSS